MRLIDADILRPDRMTNKGTVAISQSQVANAPTVKAIPIEVLREIRAEIENMADSDAYGDYQLGTNFGLMKAAQLVDRKIKEYE